MTRILYTFTIILITGAFSIVAAGNPDRQGEAGAAELLLNPWAKSAGLHSMSTASVTGVEAMRINIAGLSRIEKGELMVGNTRLYEGTGMGINAIGYASKMGSNGAIGISLMSLDFGDIPITTADQPAGTGGVYSPGFFNLGLGYAYTYKNKISVGILVRGVAESLPDVSAFGFALDAGVQYVSGPQDNFKLGIALRNTGSPMSFGGEGLSFQGDNPDPDVSGTSYNLTYDQRAAQFELPSMLNIGLSYDYYVTDDSYVRMLTNFTSNAFSKDNIGVGGEFSFKDRIILRGAYRAELGESVESEGNLYTGVAGGVTANIPLKKAGNNILGIDYAYRATNPFRGTHNLSLRLGF